ncbi:MAG: hypothetical protein ABIQ18_37455 [Umezawaea sp.]
MSAKRDTTTASDTDTNRGSLERVTVNLTPRAARALTEVVTLTGDSKTDSINRAVQIYAFLEATWTNGGSVLVRSHPEAEPELLRAF